MIMMKTSVLRTPALLATLFFVGATAFAQTPYVWIDERGVKQFSDQPPPPSVPQNRILKYSGKAMESQDVLPDVNSGTTKATKSAETLADKELAYKKRQEDLAARQKKADTDAKNAAAKADYCKRAQDYETLLESGQRVAQTDSSGNRSYLSDSDRAQQINDLNQKLKDCAN